MVTEQQKITKPSVKKGGRWLNSLKTKLFLFSSFLTGIVGLTLSIFFLLQTRNVLFKGMIEQAEQLTKILGSSSAIDLYLGNIERLNPLVESFALQPDVKDITILDNAGKVLVHTDPKEVGKVYEEEYEQKILAPGESTVHYHESTAKGEKLIEVCTLIVPPSGSIVEEAIKLEKGEGKTSSVGRTKISFTLDRLNRQKNYIIISSLVIIFLLVIIASVISFLLSSGITRPLEQLAVVAEIIAGGNLAVRAKIESKDEIGKLSRSFNTMAENLQITQEELRMANTLLEERVEERTKELEESRDELKKEFNELQRWKKTVVGRELKMIELKNEIAQLKARIGN